MAGKKDVTCRCPCTCGHAHDPETHGTCAFCVAASKATELAVVLQGVRDASDALDKAAQMRERGELSDRARRELTDRVAEMASRWLCDQDDERLVSIHRAIVAARVVMVHVTELAETGELGRQAAGVLRVFLAELMIMTDRAVTATERVEKEAGR